MSALLERPALTTVQRAPVRRYTVDEFEQLYLSPENSERLLELIQGEVCEKMPTEEHGIIAGNLVFALKAYAKQTGIGRVGVEVRHRLPQDKYNSRLPDVSYTKTDRPVVRKGSVPAMPDLAVEIQSPNDTIKAMREAAAYYLANGSQLVWLIYPKKQLIEVYHANGEVEFLVESDSLTGSDLLPGFTIAVTEAFEE